MTNPRATAHVKRVERIYVQHKWSSLMIFERRNEGVSFDSDVERVHSAIALSDKQKHLNKEIIRKPIDFCILQSQKWSASTK